MKKYAIYTLLLCSGLFLSSCGGDDPSPTPTPTPVDNTGGGGNDNQGGSNTGGETTEDLTPAQPSKTNTMNVYAHYMPWFVSPTASGGWNHWTMSVNALASDRGNLASHYYPLTGAYASNDEAVLDYQCLMMKYSGIDGVMVDWYGTQQKNDYPSNETNTRALLKAIEKAGMKFVIVYEDATLDGLSDKAGQALKDMQYVEKTYVKSSSYTKVDGKPLLMTFGPQQLTTPAGWDQALSGFTTRPQFIVLNGFSHRANDKNYTNSQGEFLWVNPNPTYNDAKNFEMYIGGAMPGFWDVYKQFNQGSGYTTYDREDGALFQRQLYAAKDAGLQWVQVSTWNDYGEGTTIEPTEEYKYQYLAILQQFCGVSYTESQLDLIYRWYKVRVAKSTDQRVAQAYKYLAALRPDKAEELIKALE